MYKLNQSNPIPNSISHKQLNSFIKSAYKESSLNETKDDGLSTEEKKFNDLKSTWSKLSKDILFNLDQNKKNLTKGKNPNSLMALGAMEVHINMALQALKASEVN